MKTNRNKSVMANNTQIHCEEMLVYLENHNFISLIPEEMDIFELCIYLLFANKIIFSTGSIIYTNKIFINPNAKLLYFRCTENGDADGLSNVKSIYINNHIWTSDECMIFAKQIIEY